MACTRAEECGFVPYCEEMGKKSAARGFAKMYCQGDMADQCVRMKICKSLGKDQVPQNMMPNGMMLPGTSNASWGAKVMEIVKAR